MTRTARRSGIALLLLGVSAIAFQQGATRPWAIATTTDGARIAVSPIGLARSSAGGDGAASVECRWWPRIGNADLCAEAVPSSGAWVRRSYPLAVAAIWTAVLALFLNALRIPRRLPSLGAVSAGLAATLGALSAWSLQAHAGTALAALQDARLNLATAGFGAVAFGMLASGLAAILLARTRPGSAAARRGGPVAG
jgi:hypothetical protein